MRNFFEHQAAAQRRSRWLLVGMPLAVFGMGALLFAFLWLMRGMTLSYLRVVTTPDAQLWTKLFWSCVLGTAALVAVASLWRMLSLRAGGVRVAELLGGRLVSGQPRDALDRRLLNVVEEMAIAAGAPVPQVFVLDSEPGINALAAGWELHDAIIAVTRGCLEKLTRAELQGVIGHEFSHVLHGDMRLNLRLMGTVFGVLFIALVGRQMMRAADLSRRNGAPVLLLGLAVVGVGGVGALFANLIKAAVTRQREFLADASAVQFTRDPAGISSALKKIGGHDQGATVSGTHAEEASHFFFGDIRQRVFSHSPFATHPPLAERIRRLDPSFRGDFPRLGAGIAEPESLAEIGAMSLDAPGTRSAPPPAALVVRLVGTANAAAMKASRAWLEQIALPLRTAAQSPYSASALVYAALLSDERVVREAQERSIEALSGAELRVETQRLAPLLQSISRADRLLLADLASPALQALVLRQRSVFSRTVQALTQADAALSIFEYVLGNMLSNQASEQRVQRRQRTLASAPREVELVVSLLVHAGDMDGNGAASAFAQAALRLRGLPIALLPSSPRLLSGLGPALTELRTLRPADSAQLVDACSHAILADQRATDDELTLLRAVCLALGVPVSLLG
jgi:Zn-dependent protease with chaperone function